MIDSHFHIWKLSREDYGWLKPELKPIYRDISPNDWRRLAKAAGVAGGILVQAAPTEAETEFLLSQADRHRDMILGVVGWIDMEAKDAPARIERLAQNSLLVGLRPMLHDLSDPAWILRPAVEPALAAIQKADLTFDALVRPAHLPYILTLARKNPNLRIVIDHGAKPDIAHSMFEPWASDLRQIGRETKAFCKISGLLTEAGARGTGDDLKPYVRHLLQCFGAKRLLWGSDWPVLELASDYSRWHAMAKALVPAEDQAQVFEQTVRAAYPRMARPT